MGVGSMNRCLTIVAVAAGVALASAPALAAGRAPAQSAPMLEKITPDVVTAALETVGLSYKIETDPRGFPMVMVDRQKLPVAQFNVLFFGCDAKGACEDIALWSWYDLGYRVSDKAIFAWNNPLGKARRWTTGYLDEQNDPALVLNINATGGIGQEAVQILFNTYIEDLFDFKDAISSARTSSNENDKSTGHGVVESVSAKDIVPSDIRTVTRLIKDHGSAGYKVTKQTDTKQ